MKREFASKKLAFAFAVMALMFWWGAGFAQAQVCDPDNPPTVDIADPSQPHLVASGKIHGTNKVAQTFKVPGSGCFTVSSITLRAIRHDFNGTKPNNLLLSIFGTTNSAEGKIPNGSALGSANYSPDGPDNTPNTSDDIPNTAIANPQNVLVTAFAAITVPFDPPVQVAGGAYYAVVIEQENGGGSGNIWYSVGLVVGTTYTEAGFPRNLHYCKSDDPWDCPATGGLPNDEGYDITMTIQFMCCNQGCTLTQGFWKTHDGSGPQPDAWPEEVTLNGLELGTQTYDKDDLVDILNESVEGGNGLVSLAHQLIAAKLNAANGASVPAAIQQAMDDADALIGSLLIPPIGSGFLDPDDTGGLTDTLDTYNNGLWPGGPPHCGE